MPKSHLKFKLVGLKVSKTDPFRKGQTIVIEKANSNLCLIPAMLTYLESRAFFPHLNAPIDFSIWFHLYLGQINKRNQAFTFKGRAWFKWTCWSQFSHRCSYDSCFKQCTPWLITFLGWWSHGGFEKYIKTPPSVLAQIPQILVILL